jgi:hypothetical protein
MLHAADLFAQSAKTLLVSLVLEEALTSLLEPEAEKKLSGDCSRESRAE